MNIVSNDGFIVKKLSFYHAYVKYHIEVKVVTSARI